MKIMLKIGLVSAMLSLAACAPPATNTNMNAGNGNANSNANVAKTTAAPSVDELLALENKAFDAWKNKDAKFFDGFLASSFVSVDEKGSRIDKAGMMKMIGDSKCEVKSFSLTNGHVTPIAPDVAVITAKADEDFTCAGKKGPTPVISVSGYVKEGDTWKGAFHNEVAIVTPKAEANSNTTAEANKAPAAPANTTAANKPAANAAAGNTAASAPAPSTGDALTDALMALEKSGWDAWMARDAAKLGTMVTNDMSFVDVMGNVANGKAETLKAWTGTTCDIKSVAVTDGKATSITPTVAILTSKGVATGTCDGQKLGPLWNQSFFVKEGDVWKLAFMMETPA